MVDGVAINSHAPPGVLILTSSVADLGTRTMELSSFEMCLCEIQNTQEQTSFCSWVLPVAYGSATDYSTVNLLKCQLQLRQEYQLSWTRAPQQIKLELPSVQRSTGSRGGQSSSANETLRCYKCDGVGHLARDCKVKKSRAVDNSSIEPEQIKY